MNPGIAVAEMVASIPPVNRNVRGSASPLKFVPDGYHKFLVTHCISLKTAHFGELSMIDLMKFPAKDSATAARVVDGEAVVIKPMESEIHTLNSVGIRIWELADGSHTVDDIIHQIKCEFDVKKENANNDTCEFIKDLITKRMLILYEKSC